MDRDVISTGAAPAAIGPYSQAIAWSNLVFASGQIPLDPASGQIASTDIEIQTRRVLDNLRAVLEAAGAGLATVLRTTIYLTDLGHFNAVNRIYGEYFTSQPPARSTVEVSRLPREALIEIDAIAART